MAPPHSRKCLDAFVAQRQLPGHNAGGRSGPATPQSDEHKRTVAGKGVCVGAEKERIS